LTVDWLRGCGEKGAHMRSPSDIRNFSTYVPVSTIPLRHKPRSAAAAGRTPTLELGQREPFNTVWLASVGGQPGEQAVDRTLQPGQRPVVAVQTVPKVAHHRF
jgi:hypothetical protein